MKKIITIVGLLLAVSVTPAHANCPSGNCDVEINCTTGVVTYRDAAPRTTVPELPVPVAPTSMVSVVTPNESFGASGSAEGVAQALQDAVSRSSNPEFIAAAEQAVIQPYVPQPNPFQSKPITANEAYDLIDFNATDWLDQFFAWFAEFFAEYQLTQEG